VTNNLKIGIDATNLLGGGGVTHLIELLSEADPARHGFSEVIVWGPQATLAQLPECYWLDKRPQGPRVSSSLLVRSIWQLTRISREARKAACDLLLVPGGSFFGGFRPFVAISQNMLPFEQPERARYGLSAKAARLWLLSKTQYLTFLRSDSVISLSQHGKSVILRRPFLGHGKIKVIPHGVNRRFYQPPRPQRPISAFTANDPMRLVYVSSIEPYKHHATLIAAIAQLRDQFGWPLHLTLAGACSNRRRQQLLAIIAGYSNGNDWISFRDFVPFDQINELMKEADIGLFASSCEACPNIVIEYMATGLPIASSGKAPMTEVLGDGAIYFDTEHAPSIAFALADFIRSPELRVAKAACAYERAHDLTWGRCADLTFTVLTETARRAGSKRK
jgi:glycosyltransferase involved in cell wall biosynthesis